MIVFHDVGGFHRGQMSRPAKRGRFWQFQVRQKFNIGPFWAVFTPSKNRSPIMGFSPRGCTASSFNSYPNRGATVIYFDLKHTQKGYFISFTTKYILFQWVLAKNSSKLRIMINYGGYDHKPANLVTVEPTCVQKEPILIILANTGHFLAKTVVLGQKWSFLVKMSIFDQNGRFF